MSAIFFTHQLPAEPFIRNEFVRHGFALNPSVDGTPFNIEDATVDISEGILRLHVLRFRNKATESTRTAGHRNTTRSPIPAHVMEWFPAIALSDADITDHHAYRPGDESGPRCAIEARR
ncbi:hypothetical protein [Nocardia sp. NPDC024068]|uniref:hypothetical protein n=1 Tax=Nocardia sp. NPDC024068 TaxID=3157197 RepID=UPI0034084F30